MSEIWDNQSVFVTAILLAVAAVLLGRIARPFLAGWLGLTDRNAKLLSGAVVVGIWLVLFLVMVGTGSGNSMLDSSFNVPGIILTRSWWIAVVIAVSLAYKWLRK